MAKLGYTWYPKDWGNSEKVFELTLIERGLYRELIDMAMLNDNKTEINLKVWSRKYACSIDELGSILITLENLDLIEVNDNTLFIPSCEARLNLVRGGRNGGKKSKPNSKPTKKPIESLEEKNEKPTPNQIEKKLKGKETKDDSKESLFDIFWTKYPKKVAKENCRAKFNKLSTSDKDKILSTLDAYILYKPFKDYTHPNPETYLNQKRWNDEVPTENKQQVKSNDKFMEYVRMQEEKYTPNTNKS